MPLDLFLQGQIDSLSGDLRQLRELLASGKFPKNEQATIQGRFNIALSPLLHEIQVLIESGLEGKPAWEQFEELKKAAQVVLNEALQLTGGIAVRQSGLDGGFTAHAQEYLQYWAALAGVDWQPVVVIGSSKPQDAAEESVVEKNAGDRLVSLPLPHWDLWSLPALLHSLGFWIAKSGEVDEIRDLAQAAAGRVRALLSETPPTEAEPPAFLPEVRLLAAERIAATDLAGFQARYSRRIERLALRQQIYLWRLAADCLAAYLAGPVYAFALLFQSLDPAGPEVEGEAAAVRSRYLPSDLRRAAAVLGTLERLDKSNRPDEYSASAYTADLKYLGSIWNEVLQAQGQLAAYQAAQAAVAPWLEALYPAIESRYQLASREGLRAWQAALDEYVPLLRDGDPQARQVDLVPLVSAAWYWRIRCPDRVDLLEQDCTALLDGSRRSFGGAKLTGMIAPLLFQESRRADLRTYLDRLEAFFRSELISVEDRRAVSGRFYRLLSQQEYQLESGEKSANPLEAATRQLLGRSLQELVDEIMDFLGGVFIRQEGLDGGACAAADGLLSLYSANSGIPWLARAVPGENPLFSQAVDLVHLHFPDWEVWNLPLLAHEFGHITVSNTPGFRELFASELNTLSEGHPQAAAWTAEQRQAYLAARAAHLHEFFADAYAVFTQGPAFVFAALYLNFNPAQAYASRTGHPSHAERAALIFSVLEAMDEQAKASEYDTGPYAGWLKRANETWNAAVQAIGVPPSPEDAFNLVKARQLGKNFFGVLDYYFRLGAQYSAEDWERAVKLASTLLADSAGLAKEDLRSLLSVAWAARLRQPERKDDIGRIAREAINAQLATS